MISSPIFKDQLQAPSRQEDLNYWADYIEILCWTELEGKLSVDAVLDRWLDAKNLRINSTEIDGEHDHSESTYFNGSTTSPDYDRIQNYVESVFEFLMSRQTLFEKKYPFEVTQDSISLLDEISAPQNLYLCLLLSSNLYLVDNYKKQITSGFEDLGVKFLRNILSEGFKVHYFGKGSEIENPFPKDLFERFEKLSSLLKIPLTFRVNRENVGVRNTGDNGLDIVAWFEFNNQQPGTMMFFVQCACGKDWFEKQADSHVFRWRNIFQFINPPINLVLIPRSYRNRNGNWHNLIKIDDSVIIDRYRLLTSTILNIERFVEPYQPFLQYVASAENKRSYFD
ncbi:MAG: hypothetical protein AAFR61_23625 [Bacteroidota bacterium]